ncbi:uncharacterized protein LOC123548874 [Mercenaria mercenaria]|uniref:uncharacterized protein LOC123548874 n=1 Tax=Mercenaria mercenaria TaxID=6596 RepID=UPI00234F1740|nr:uncharacterized protein LOC123548874 [Mercenaria mercenaria]
MTEDYSAKVFKEYTSDNKTESDEENENIVITVGETSVKVNREKLIQGSDYFKALFEGDFADSTKKKVDISEVVSSADILKNVVAFFSSGDIAIEPNNIEDLLKLSSYFQFHTLLKKCGNYINDTLTVETCLSYFILSKSYNLTEAETASGRLLKARFHDYILHQESTLDISPAVLADLCERGFLTFCECFSLLKFISQWVCRGLSKDHVTTGLKVLRYIDGALLQAPLHVSVQVQSVGKILVDLKNALKCNEEEYELLRHLEITINNMITKAGRVNVEENETVLLTVSGRKSAPTKSGPIRAIPGIVGVDYVESLTSENEPGAVDTGKFNNDISEDDIDVSEMQVLDVCVYEPRCKVWYRLTTLHRDWIKSLPFDIRYTLLKGNFECDIVLFENKVFLVYDPTGMLSFDLETCVWSGITSASKECACEMLQEIYGTISSDGYDSSLNVLNGDLYLSYEDLFSNVIFIKMFNKETRLFENICSSTEFDIDKFHDTVVSESVRSKTLCLFTLSQLSRKSKRLMSFILNDHDNLELFFSSCVEDSEQPCIIVRNEMFYDCDEENVTEDKVHYKINDIGAVDTDKSILFVVVKDSMAEASELTPETLGIMKEAPENAVTLTESGSTVGTTEITTERIESESMVTSRCKAGSNESERMTGATGCTTEATELYTGTEKFHVIGEYDLATRKIKFRKGFPKKDISEICIHMKAERDDGCSENVRSETFGGQDGFWRIKTASDGTSCCYNVTSAEFKVTQHVPPPFSHIISGCETELPRKLLAILEPINYLSCQS